MKKISELIIRFRWLIIVSFIIVTVVFGMQLQRVEIDSAMKSQLPEDMPSRVTTDSIDELFGGTEMIVVIVKTEDVLNPETLERVRLLSKRMKRIKGIDKVMSLFELKDIKGEDGAMIVNPAVDDIPTTPEQVEELRQRLKENDLVYGSVVSEDFSATAVIGMIEIDITDQYIVDEVRKLIEKTPGNEETIIGGLPFVRYNIGKDISGDMRRLLPFALLIMLVFLFISFKQLRGVLLPFTVVIMSIVFAIGLIPLLGWKIQVITVLLPVMLVAIANDYGIHLIARYQEDNKIGGNLTKVELAKSGFMNLGKPILLTGLTTIVGMLCLLGHVILPAEQLGILAATGILYALTASLLFIPAVLSIIPRAKPILHGDDSSARRGILDRMLILLGKIVSSKPVSIIVIAVVITILSGIGIFRVIVDTNPENYYPDDSEVVYANHMTNKYFGGSTNISVVFEGDIKQPGLMHRMDSLEGALRELPEIGNTTSIARVVRQMSRAINDEGETGYDQIPDTRNAVAQYFELYSMSGDPDDFEKLIDFPYEHAQVSARINEVSSSRIDWVVDRARELTKDDSDVTLVGGFATILAELARLIVRGQVISLTLAVILVGVLMILLFRSIIAGFFTIIPLGVSMVLLFGLMGYFGIELNIATAMLSSIMIGIGIDYTIHFLWRYREEVKGGLKHVTAVQRTLTTTGRGIVFNALSVIIGFIVLLISSFMPVKFFGFLIIVSVGSCLVGALILVPALCLVIKPGFLENER